MKYPLLPLSGFPYRITQYILKFPILIIAENLASTTLYITLRKHVHKNTTGAIYVLDGIWDLIESVSEGFLTYS